MPLPDILLLLCAGFAAGGMNALAGGGTFFPQHKSPFCYGYNKQAP